MVCLLDAKFYYLAGGNFRLNIYWGNIIEWVRATMRNISLGIEAKKV